jgi:hypothetical protein
MQLRIVAGTISGAASLLGLVHVLWPNLGIDTTTIALVFVAAILS